MNAKQPPIPAPQQASYKLYGMKLYLPGDQTAYFYIADNERHAKDAPWFEGAEKVENIIEQGGSIIVKNGDRITEYVGCAREMYLFRSLIEATNEPKIIS